VGCNLHCVPFGPSRFLHALLPYRLNSLTLSNVFTVSYHVASGIYLSRKISTPFILFFPCPFLHSLIFPVFTQTTWLSPFPDAPQIPLMHQDRFPVCDELEASPLTSAHLLMLSIVKDQLPSTSRPPSHATSLMAGKGKCDLRKRNDKHHRKYTCDPQLTAWPLAFTIREKTYHLSLSGRIS